VQQNEPKLTNREKQLRQKLAIIYQQIELLRRYPEEFEKALGKKGIEEWLDKTLDEANEIRRRIREING